MNNQLLRINTLARPRVAAVLSALTTGATGYVATGHVLQYMYVGVGLGLHYRVGDELLEIRVLFSVR